MVRDVLALELEVRECDPATGLSSIGPKINGTSPDQPGHHEIVRYGWYNLLKPGSAYDGGGRYRD